jgi:P27 family predicted phage terminase small subunit
MATRGPKTKERPPTPVPGRPVAPDDLSKEARQHYVKIVERLEEGGLLSMLDEDALAVYIVIWERWRKALGRIDEEGEVVVLNNKVLAKNPWLVIATESEKEMRTLLGQLGLTPASRSRIKTGPKLDETDPKWDVF